MVERVAQCHRRRRQSRQETEAHGQGHRETIDKLPTPKEVVASGKQNCPMVSFRGDSASGADPPPHFFVSVDSAEGYRRFFDKCGFQSTCRNGTGGESFAGNSSGPVRLPSIHT